jgi:hypothetical protein
MVLARARFVASEDVAGTCAPRRSDAVRDDEHRPPTTRMYNTRTVDHLLTIVVVADVLLRSVVSH